MQSYIAPLLTTIRALTHGFWKTFHAHPYLFLWALIPETQVVQNVYRPIAQNHLHVVNAYHLQVLYILSFINHPCKVWRPFAIFGTLSLTSPQHKFVLNCKYSMVIWPYYGCIIAISINHSCNCWRPFAIFALYLVHHPGLNSTTAHPSLDRSLVIRRPK